MDKKMCVVHRSSHRTPGFDNKTNKSSAGSKKKKKYFRGNFMWFCEMDSQIYTYWNSFRFRKTVQHETIARPVEIYTYRETLKFIYSDREIQWIGEAKGLYLYVTEGYGNING